MNDLMKPRNTSLSYLGIPEATKRLLRQSHNTELPAGVRAMASFVIGEVKLDAAIHYREQIAQPLPNPKTGIDSFFELNADAQFFIGRLKSNPEVEITITAGQIVDSTHESPNIEHSNKKTIMQISINNNPALFATTLVPEVYKQIEAGSTHVEIDIGRVFPLLIRNDGATIVHGKNNEGPVLQLNVDTDSLNSIAKPIYEAILDKAVLLGTGKVAFLDLVRAN